MKVRKPKSVAWLYEHAHPRHWAELYFPGRRYGHLTSNIAESFNSVILQAREMPMLALLETIRTQLMGWFSERRQLDENATSIVVTKITVQIQDIIQFSRSRSYRYKHCRELVYEVASSKPTIGIPIKYLVNIAEHSCSCRVWRARGIPCAHGCAVIIGALKQSP